MVFCNIVYRQSVIEKEDSHNPYFSRWFSAIDKEIKTYNLLDTVTILILVDGFLQLILTASY